MRLTVIDEVMLEVALIGLASLVTVLALWYWQAHTELRRAKHARYRLLQIVTSEHPVGVTLPLHEYMPSTYRVRDILFWAVDRGHDPTRVQLLSMREISQREYDDLLKSMPTT